MTGKVSLKRTLSLPMMVLYGLGTTIGAGIYALIGEIAGVAGYFAPISFLVASLMAGLTAISFAELCGRFPQAAGAAVYVKQGFSSNGLSTIVGLLVIAAGLASASALINGFVGYLHQFIGVDRILVIVLLTLVLGGIAAWGIAESVAIASLITVVEIGGLF
ncbi:MAG: amino acid permease, partial [Proteobacteria bacterium]|nr:amino acid permease [Pseudomonadota bacterium]